MKKLIASLAVLTLTLAGALSISVQAQTTEEGPGPSEQPSAPMEMGQQYPSPSRPGQPQAGKHGEEAKPGGPSDEGPA
jgi:hypothetical protein